MLVRYLVWKPCKESSSVYSIHKFCPRNDDSWCLYLRMKYRCNSLWFWELWKSIWAFSWNFVLKMPHIGLNPTIPYQWHNQMTRPNSSSYSGHQLVNLNNKIITFKWRLIVQAFIFELHVLNNYLREINACYIFIALFVHVLT